MKTTKDDKKEEEKVEGKCENCEEKATHIVVDGKDTAHYCKHHAERYYKQFINR